MPATAIDGPGPLSAEDRQARLQAADWLSDTPRAGSVQSIDPSIDYALALLDVSDRTDAIGHEPLTGGANAAAFARARTMDWRRYRYGAMIVTGVGPEIAGEALSPSGKYHLRLAASRFARGDIAFILVTGGRAHPRATPFTEADEMRKALIERYGIPEAIVSEPYARHTTTNLRNASRLLARLGMPADTDTLIVCNPMQSTYIESAKFAARNMTELGYQPGRIVRRLTPTELVFRPSPYPSASIRAILSTPEGPAMRRFILAAALILSPATAHAWGRTAHAVIDRAAIQAIPDDGPVFLRRYADYIAASADVPDSWRNDAEGFSKIEEDPNHGWFREQFAFLKPIPRSRYEFILALYKHHEAIKNTDPATAARTNVRWTGTLPYAAMEAYDRLIVCMRAIRAAQATGGNASVPEQNCAFQAIRLGHYIGDGSQPLHDSVNSDGWRGRTRTAIPATAASMAGLKATLSMPSG